MEDAVKVPAGTVLKSEQRKRDKAREKRVAARERAGEPTPPMRLYELTLRMPAKQIGDGLPDRCLVRANHQHHARRLAATHVVVSADLVKNGVSPWMKLSMAQCREVKVDGTEGVLFVECIGQTGAVG